MCIRDSLAVLVVVFVQRVEAPVERARLLAGADGLVEQDGQLGAALALEAVRQLSLIHISHSERNKRVRASYQTR